MSFRDLERAVRVPNVPTPAKPDLLSSSAKPVVKAPETVPETAPDTAPKAE